MKFTQVNSHRRLEIIEYNEYIEAFYHSASCKIQKTKSFSEVVCKGDDEVGFNTVLRVIVSIELAKNVKIKELSKSIRRLEWLFKRKKLKKKSMLVRKQLEMKSIIR